MNLVRAELFFLTQDMPQACLYLSHSKKEYLKMLQIKNCRPLILLNDIQEKEVSDTEEQEIWKQMEQICSSSKTASLFKSKAFKQWLLKKVPRTLKRIRQMQTLFSTYPITKTIYGSTLNRHGALVTSVAQSKQLFTVNIQHGLVGELGHLPLNADLHLVWGEADARYLESFGANRQQLHVCGPVFIRNYEAKHVPTEQNESSPKKMRVLVALQPLGRVFNRRMIQMIEKAASGVSEPLIIDYKLHPDQGKGKRYQSLLCSPFSKLIPHHKGNLQSLLSQADIIITHSSAVAYEGLLQNKAILFYGPPIPFYYLRGTPFFFQDSLCLQEVFAKALQRPQFLEELRSRCTLIDQGDPNRAKENIKEVLFK